MNTANQEAQSTVVESRTLEQPASVYEALCAKINLTPVRQAQPFETFQNSDALSESSIDERIAVAVNVFLKMVQKSSQQVDRLDKSLLDFHIAALDEQIIRPTIRARPGRR